MVVVGICEDNAVQLKQRKMQVNKILEKNNFISEILTFKSGEEILENYPEGIDILLLDIKMDKLSGMETAYKIRNFDNNVKILFTTSFEDYALEGYKVNAYGYLIKPIDMDDLEKNIMYCIDKIKEQKKSIVIKCNSGIEHIYIYDIIYVEVIRKEIIIHTESSDYTAKISMNAIEKEISYNIFFRCHKSYLINIKKVSSLNKDSIRLTNKDIPVSKYRYKNLKIALINVLGEHLC